MSDIRVDISEPSARQKLFLKAKHTHIAFGGARGGGKSWSVRTKASLLAARYPTIRIMIVRRTFPELYQNHISVMTRLLNGIATYRTTTKELIFLNGSVILFRYCRNVQDLDKLQGLECDVLFIDEATQFTEEMYDRLRACVRGVNNFPKRIYLTCNPGGVGHTWVKRLFIDRAYRADEDPEEYYFIKSRVTDNKALMENDPSYIKKLQALPPKLRRAWLDGDWDIFEGQFFEEFTDDPDHYEDRRLTHVIAPFNIPPGWTIYRSFDWGFSKPFSCDWWAIDYEGRAYLILQLYGCKTDTNGTVLANEGLKWSDNEVFTEIHRIECEHPWLRGRKILGVADPSIWAEDGGTPIIRAADRHMVYFYKADNTRIPGWMQCHYRLRFDKEGYPMVYFFNTCKHAIRTIPLLQFDEKRPEDLDTTGEDHFADSFRYFCMANPMAPKEAEPEDDYYSTPAALNLDIPKEMLSRPRSVPKLEYINKNES